MSINLQQAQFITRRHFLRRCQVGLGSLALGSLMGRAGASAANPMAPHLPPLAGKVKNVIYLHMAGSPPQLDLFDYKPKLNELNNKPCPKEFIEGRRLPFIKGHPKLLGSPHTFKQHGQNGQWISNMYPTLPGLADDLTFVKSMYTDQFNHAPAQMLLYTGSPRNGSASMGSWVTYGLGSENSNLPGFVVLISGDTDPSGGKSLWGSGYLPSVFQGVQCRSTGDPILYVSNPKGMSRDVRRRSLDALRKLNEQEYREIDRYCRERGITWFASPWDTDSVDFMEQFAPACYKVASACLTDDELLKKVSDAGRVVILSTGMSTLEQIRHAVSLLDQKRLIITHCTSSYPCKPGELNLRMIPTLRNLFSCPIGYSGHEVGLPTTYAALVMGACLVERHITLDRSMWGSDQAASVEPQGLVRLVRDLHVTETALGDGIKRVYESEIPVMEKLRRASG